MKTLGKGLLAEGIGTALLLTVVVGSGIMGEQLLGASDILTLLVNSIATGAGLVALILMFQNVSGAHFNPAVTLVEAVNGNISKRSALLYVFVQISSAFVGVMLAHWMFGFPAFELAARERSGSALLLSEFIASFGLIAVILGVSKNNKAAVPFAVGLYILSAYWFTSSTSFANPAVTLARAFTPTFTGIRLVDVFPFWGAQIVGALSAGYLFKYLGNEK